jgi:hypothetical protein
MILTPADTFLSIVDPVKFAPRGTMFWSEKHDWPKRRGLVSKDPTA